MEQEYQNALSMIGHQQIQIAKLQGALQQAQAKIKELEEVPKDQAEVNE